MKKFIAVAALAALALAGCAATPEAEDDGLVHVVASTNVYGDIARSIGGDLVDVTSIIEDPAQDPHSFEADARVQLALSKADVVIENGGGYDDFVDTLLRGADNAGATVLNAVDISGLDTSGEFNEHVWYNFEVVGKVVDSLTETLSAADPASAATFTANAAAFHTALDTLQQKTATLKGQFAGTAVTITEPVPGYLLDAIGLDNVTPEAFSEAIEEGTDVSPAVLADTLALFTGGTAKLLVYNEQTTGPETEDVLDAAKAAGVPVVPVTETLPAGTDYIGWMTSNIDAIDTALSQGN